MALDPNRWTLKTQESINGAIEAAKAAANPEVTPDHLLLALLGQEEGVVLPILQKVGKPRPSCAPRPRRPPPSCPRRTGATPASAVS